MFPFIGEIRGFGFGYAPNGWASCDGQLMTIAENAALFSLLGTQYGGDGQTSFRLPDLRGRLAVSSGQGPGLNAYTTGDAFGTEAETLSIAEMAAHSHAPLARTSPDAGTAMHSAPQAGDYLSSFSVAETEAGLAWSAPPLPSAVTMHPDFVGSTGSNLAHENRQPFLAFNYCIALEGIYPVED